MLLSLVLVSLLALKVTGQTTGLPPVSTLVTTAGCNTTKQCFFNPLGSTCQEPTCMAIATWTQSATPGYLDFELWAGLTTTTNQGWVALGLSYDEKMGNDSVMDCLVNTAGNNALAVNVSYNQISSGVPFNRPLSYAPKSTTVINKSASYTNGALSCRFSRSIAADGPEVFTLNASYYLLLAYGPVIGGSIAQHSFNPYPVVSPSQVNLAASAPPIAPASTTAKITSRLPTSVPSSVAPPTTKPGTPAASISTLQSTSGKANSISVGISSSSSVSTARLSSGSSSSSGSTVRSSSGSFISTISGSSSTVRSSSGSFISTVARSGSTTKLPSIGSTNQAAASNSISPTKATIVSNATIVANVTSIPTAITVSITPAGGGGGGGGKNGACRPTFSSFDYKVLLFSFALVLARVMYRL